MTNLTATQGDTIALATTITRKNPETGVVAPVDITAAKLWFTAKYDLSQSDADAVIQLGSAETDFDGIDKSQTPTDGKAVVTIKSDLTQDLSPQTVFLFWDIQMEEADLTVTTVDSGRLALVNDATKVF